MVNKAYIAAKDSWDSDTTEKEREEILDQIKYTPNRSTKWNDLPKYVRKKLERMYADTLYPDETFELHPGQNYHCNPGEAWVPSHRKKDGTYVHGYCRRLKLSGRKKQKDLHRIKQKSVRRR